MKLISSLLLIIFLSTITLIVSANEIKYKHNSITIDELKEKMDFKLLVPVKIPEEWTLEIKTHDYKDGNVSGITLHYLNENKEKLMIRIEEKKASKRGNQSMGRRVFEGR
ncbi:hypothetical protein [Bacillus sp. SG-1]|uniref:hypothetical protein n=1 Tax=Bacillus sp. SG-1 TaxID=161544 RepID=UPI000154431A|nr:hypothetical protein [Bacillus sp. SG-1]EDL66447.1 hypothetical protein BSG1_03805 [Bacillus sp. SG-1]